MYQRPKCSCSFYFRVLEFNFRVHFPCEILIEQFMTQKLFTIKIGKLRGINPWINCLRINYVENRKRTHTHVFLFISNQVAKDLTLKMV